MQDGTTNVIRKIIRPICTRQKRETTLVSFLPPLFRTKRKKENISSSFFYYPVFCSHIIPLVCIFQFYLSPFDLCKRFIGAHVLSIYTRCNNARIKTPHVKTASNQGATGFSSTGVLARRERPVARKFAHRRGFDRRDVTIVFR